MTDGNGWEKYQVHVLAELKRISESVEADRKDRQTFREATNFQFNSLREAVSALNVKAGIWGGVAGLAAAIGVLLFEILKG